MGAAQILASALHPDSDWQQVLAGHFQTDAFERLAEQLAQREASGERVFPAHHLCFNALNATPLSRVRVVILGQDPYHGPGQAHGLSFSVPPGTPPPPSLQNIFREIHRDLGLSIPEHGCLGYWAQQGVLLLNSVLTVTQGQAGSHQGLGWEGVTEQILAALLQRRTPQVFLLWGKQAQQKLVGKDTEGHLVLKTTHPSPLSAHRGFLGCGHFSQANQWLQAQGARAIDWRLPPRQQLDDQGFLA